LHLEGKKRILDADSGSRIVEGDVLEAVHQWYMLEGAVLKPPRYLQEPSSESDAWQQIGPEAQIGTANFTDFTAEICL
jgi:hypothetical protein